MNDIKATRWTNILNARDREAETFDASDVDVPIAVSDGNGIDLSDAALFRAKDGRHVFFERKYQDGEPLSESIIIGSREKCEAGIPLEVRQRLNARLRDGETAIRLDRLVDEQGR